MKWQEGFLAGLCHSLPLSPASGVRSLMTTGRHHSTKQLAACFPVQCLFQIATLCLFYGVGRGLVSSDTCPRSHANKRHRRNSSGATAGSCPRPTSRCAQGTLPCLAWAHGSGSLTSPKGQAPDHPAVRGAQETRRTCLVKRHPGCSLAPKPLRPTPPHLSTRAPSERTPRH